MPSADQRRNVAVVGATDNSGKYGYVIYRDLKRKGYTIYPVNSNRSEIDGDKAYSRLAEIPEKPTIVNIVVPRNAMFVGWLIVRLKTK